MKAHFKIRRYNPENDAKPYWQEFTVDDVIPTDRVLELMHRIKWEQDGTLSCRRSCAHGVCGSDAMRINGVNMLACKVLVSNMVKNESATEVKIQVEPILGLPVVKDLIVDMEPFFDHYKAVIPYFITNMEEPKDGREYRQSIEARAIFDDTTKCILCACCTTSCPSFWANGSYVGPAAMVQAHRFIFDDRDCAAQERLDIMASPDGVWRCRTVFNCTPACPREIEVTRAIGEVKKAIQLGAERVSQELIEVHNAK